MDDDEGLTFALSSQSLIARIAEKAGSASKASASSRVIGPPSKQSSIVVHTLTLTPKIAMRKKH